MASTAATSSDSHLEVLEMNQVLGNVGGLFQFKHSSLVFRDSGKLFHAVSGSRFQSSSEVGREHLADIKLIPVSAYMPPFRLEFALASEVPGCEVFVKQPQLSGYGMIRHSPQQNRIADDLLREVEVYELLKQNPHPNIAKYLGCQVEEGRISGICLPQYERTLLDAVNPGSFNKRHLQSTRTAGLGEYEAVLEGVENGIRHLHSLGIIHNDINPNNIMLDGDTAFLIDFGSCRREGESLADVGRTYEWYDVKVQTSLPTNDLDALEEIRTWLGDTSNPFLFTW